MRSYWRSVSIRNLFAILVALAVLFAPAFSRAGEAFAKAPEHAQMMEPGHCKAPPVDSSNHYKDSGKDCCVSMCMAVAIAPMAPLRLESPVPTAPVFALPTLHRSYLGEIATPPPRQS